MKAIKKNLFDHILQPQYKNIFMYCEICNEQLSANAGDYWNVPNDHVFKCCNQAMQLYKRETHILPSESDDYFTVKLQELSKSKSNDIKRTALSLKKLLA